ncbi:MAG: phosphotransferase, partial [Sediminibacterium sp.]|nr:phosphotransferase [Sediminibacterium sp.]
MEKTVALSENESIDINQLNDLLNKNITSVTPIISITRFAGGYSNLTYRLATSNQNFVMRMAPAGAKIQSAHDMEREYKVLNTLRPFFIKVPQPILYYNHSDIAGTPFYIMEEIEGIILRAYNAPKLNISPNQFG